MTQPFDLVQRDSPLLISIPHLGQSIPQDLRERYTDEALALADTDWHLDKLYDFAEALGASVLRATVSRYVIDLNRPASGESLYPGLVTTSLCPTETFRGEPLYLPGKELTQQDQAQRVEQVWRPYHDTIKSELARLRRSHGQVLLWEAHSIASVLPRLFDGKLPDFNFGTADGSSCDASVAAAAIAPLRGTDWSWVLNGRFKGGFITRRYGAPTEGVQAIQLEMCQSLYMDETAPFGWRPDLADDVRPSVRASVEAALAQVRALPPA